MFELDVMSARSGNLVINETTGRYGVVKTASNTEVEISGMTDVEILWDGDSESIVYDVLTGEADEFTVVTNWR